MKKVKKNYIWSCKQCHPEEYHQNQVAPEFPLNENKVEASLGQDEKNNSMVQEEPAVQNKDNLMVPEKTNPEKPENQN